MLRGRRGNHKGRDERKGLNPVNISTENPWKIFEKQTASEDVVIDKVAINCRCIKHRGTGRQKREYQQSHIAL